MKEGGSLAAQSRDHRIRGFVGGGSQHCETIVSAIPTPTPQESEEKIDYQNIQHTKSFVKGGGRDQPCETTVSAGLSPAHPENEEKIDQQNIHHMQSGNRGGGSTAALSRDHCIRDYVGGGGQPCETTVSALPTPTLPTCPRPVVTKCHDQAQHVRPI